MIIKSLISVMLFAIFFSKAVYASAQPQSTRVFIFVSASMSETSLIQWMQQARNLQPHAALIMRGFVHDSLPETRAFIGRLVKASQGQGGVSIDPALFKKYDIKEVPAVVVETFHQGSPANEEKFDVVYGNTSLITALRTISEKGDTADSLKNLISNNSKNEDEND